MSGIVAIPLAFKYQGSPQAKEELAENKEMDFRSTVSATRHSIPRLFPSPRSTERRLAFMGNGYFL